ncbi:MAG: PD-(D/E)XK nuclease family protein, partial [Chthoniobacteraceae bacterium]
DGVTEKFAGTPFRADTKSPAHAGTTPEDCDPGVAGNVSLENAALTPTFGRTVHVTPSGTGERGEISIAHILSPANRNAMRRGELIHDWLRQIGWHEDGLPDAEQWITSAVETARELERRDVATWARGLITEIQTAGTELHRALSRPTAGTGEKIELWRERRFAVVRETGGRNEVISGSFDRVVLWRDTNGKLLRATIMDFKTDGFSSSEERSAIEARYVPQLEAYCDALCLLCPELEKRAVSASLVFVSA